MGQTLTAAQFETLYREVAPQIYGYVCRHGRPDAEDIVAEVFVTAWRRRAELPSAPLRRAWLFGTARRLLLAAARSDRRDRSVLAHLATVPDGESAPLEDAVAHVVRAALGRLRPADRELIELVEWERMTPAELAIVLSLRPGAVRVRLHRARKALAGDPQMQELITNSARTDPSVALPSQPRRC